MEKLLLQYPEYKRMREFITAPGTSKKRNELFPLAVSP
jgi:hypothetical protein